MEKEELKRLFQEELKAYASANLLTKEVFDQFKTDMEKQYGEAIGKTEFEKSFEKLSNDLTKKLEENRPVVEGNKEFKEKLHNAIKNFDISNPNSKQYFTTTQKAIYSEDLTSDTDSRKLGGVGEIKRGMPYMRNLFNIVQVGSDSHGTISWWEQASITNNSEVAAEVRNAAGMTQSDITWVKKTLGDARIHDFIKIGVDQIKDVAFVEGEVRRLIERNMRLKENYYLLNGTGLNNQIKGILAYAQAFVTTNILIPKANLIDLIGKCKTQIDKDMLGAATPNAFVVNRSDVDTLRYAKTTDGAYLFPQWALGTSDMSIAGMSMVENPLITANTLVMGDFSLATLFVWDDLVIEMYYEGTDKRDGLVTVGAYLRENLRVQDVDVKAFVKVTDVATTIATITEP